jgi:hypothetical protein
LHVLVFEPAQQEKEVKQQERGAIEPQIGSRKKSASHRVWLAVIR